MNARLSRILNLLPTVLAAGLYMSCSDLPADDDPYDGFYGGDDKATSSIVPMAPVIPNTDTIRL